MTIFRLMCAKLCSSSHMECSIESNTNQQPSQKYRRSNVEREIRDLKNDNIDMYVTNDRYQTECALCGMDVRYLTNHYVRCHPSKEVWMLYVHLNLIRMVIWRIRSFLNIVANIFRAFLDLDFPWYIEWQLKCCWKILSFMIQVADFYKSHK